MIGDPFDWRDGEPHHDATNIAPAGHHYFHVDVFSSRSYSGNSLPVFLNAEGLSATQMLRVTQELRHFEAIFLSPASTDYRVAARVFDQFDELPFAGHPVIGAAAVLHHTSGAVDEETWWFELPAKTVSVTTNRTATGYSGLLDQGRADFLGETDATQEIADAFGLSRADFDASLPLAVVSTGLKYLIVPVVPGSISKAAIHSDLTEILESLGAEFAVLLDDAAGEIRHWNNDGVIEDIATGSAAGTIGAYRLNYRRARSGEMFLLNQGRFTGRPSQLRVQPSGGASSDVSVKVGGDVVVVGHGTLDELP